MKRKLAFFLAIIMAMSLVACSGISESEVKETAEVVVGDSTEAAKNTEQTQAPSKSDVSIEETVLVEENGIKITAKSLVEDEFFGPEIKLLIENNSGKNLTFQCRNASVNGYMVDTMMSVDVADGKKANDSLTFSDSDFEQCGIETIANIEMAFHIFTTEDWDTYLDTDMIQLKTSATDEFVQTYDDSGEVAYEGNDIRVVIKGLSEDASIMGPGIVVYIENMGDKDITVQAREVSINGFMVDSIFSCDVVAGKRAVDTITFMESDLEENEITEITDVELFFHIFGMEDWDTIVDTDVVRISY